MSEENIEYFKIETGVRQGCILSPFLFLLVVDFIMKNSVDGTEIGIPWKRRSSSKKSSKDVISNICSRLADLDYADDIALITESREDLQELTNKFGYISGKV